MIRRPPRSTRTATLFPYTTLFRFICAVAPEGSLLNPKFPAAVGGRACTGHYVPIVVFGAMHQVLPTKVMAGVGSPLWIANLSGTRDDGKPFATLLFFNGGLGATAITDGASPMSWHSHLSSTPVQISQLEPPQLFPKQ